MSSIVESIPYTGYGVDANGYLTGVTGLKFPELWLGTSNSEVKLTADIATLNRLGSLTGRLVACTAATLTLSPALHAGNTVVQNAASGCAITLPAATGTGDVYKIFVKTTITSVGLVISTASLDTDVFSGVFAHLFTDDADGVGVSYASTATMNTITLNGTTTGGYAGAFIELQDVATATWRGVVYTATTGAEATPLSDV